MNSRPDFNSAGVPVPTFEVQSKELEEEYWWRMKTYEENFIKPYIESLKQKYVKTPRIPN